MRLKYIILSLEEPSKKVKELIADFEKPKYKAILEKREIKGWRTQISVILAKAMEQYVSIQSEDVILLLRATGKIKQGQLVSATNYDLFINEVVKSFTIIPESAELDCPIRK